MFEGQFNYEVMLPLHFVACVVCAVLQPIMCQELEEETGSIWCLYIQGR